MRLPFTLDDDDDRDDVQRAGQSDRDGVLSWLARASEPAGDGRYRFVASEGAVDRHGDVVDQSWRLRNWRANPVILWEHGRDVVGKGSAKVETGSDGVKRLMLDVEFHASPLNPLGMLAEEQHRLGFRSAVSVGFRPGVVTSRTKLDPADPAYVDGSTVPEWRAGYVYRSNELLEVSTVAVPALPSALQVRAHAAEAEDPEQQVRRLLAEMTGPQVRAILADVAKRNEEFRRAVRSYVLGAKAPPQITGVLPWEDR